MATFLCCALFALTNLQNLVPSSAMPVKDSNGGMKYLNHFGYISDKEMGQGNMSMSDPRMKSKLKIFQEYSGLRTTGNLDTATMAMMSSPRCGNKDLSIIRRMSKKGARARRRGQLSHRSKRFVTHSSWNKKFLTYELLNYPKCCINASVANAQISEAFKFWRDAISSTKIKIRKRRKNEPKADIEIKFTTDPHGDNLYFGDMKDMYGRAVAHAFYPLQDDPNDPLRGDIHFNNNENWTSGVREGQNFLQTATHEIGHALGLEHSMEKSAAMFYRVQSYDENFKLHDDDIQGIRALYVHNNGTVAPVNPMGHHPPPRIPTGRNLPHPGVGSALPTPPIDHKRKGWHCQKLVHHFDHTLMIAEQCLGDPPEEFLGNGENGSTGQGLGSLPNSQ